MIINHWAFAILFMCAAEGELLCSLLSEKAHSHGDYSRDDAPRMGNVQSIEVDPRDSPCVFLSGYDLHHPRCCYRQRSEEYVGYVDTG